ncbi:MAG: hypothetical protein KDC49_20595 [Saprospiraceae bacterium]|nr:hypothetical protein [Saprospiraceae bacterium]
MEKIIFRLKSIKIVQVFTILLRYLLGTAFVWASILKIKGMRFEPQSGENAPMGSLSHLLEAMYRTGFYWDFIGWGQLMAGLLIMSQIFSTLGAVVYFPIMLSIFILTTTFESPVFLVMTSLMLLSNIYLLLWDWNKLKFIVLPHAGEYVDQRTQFSEKKIWTFIGLLLGAAIVVFRIITTN